MIDYSEYDEGRHINYWENDPVLQHEIRRVYRGDIEAGRKKFREYGELLGDVIADNSDEVDRYPPELHTYDRDGELINEVEYHPSQHENERLTFEHGVVADSFKSLDGNDEPLPLLHSLGMYYLMCYVDIGLACTVSMTGGVAYVLEQHSDGSLQEYFDGLTARNYGDVIQGAMFLTEKQGGSDVGANETTAERVDGEWLLNGEKWFCSNIDAGAPLVLARQPNAPQGTDGLSLFLVPPEINGEPNGVYYRRLKNKLGTKSVPTGEVELNDAKGYLIGETEEGFKYMSTMLNYERVTNALGSAGIIGRALLESKIHAANREAFGKKLEEHPLMQHDLVEMTVEHEAATAFAFEAASILDRYREGIDTYGLMRVVVPVAKYRTARMAVDNTSYAMEILGGNGYVEDYVTHRLLRDAQVSPIWEGTSNIMALETLKGLQVSGAPNDLLDQIDEYLDVGHPHLNELSKEVGRERDNLEESFLELVSRNTDYAELHAKKLADYIFDVYTAALLIHEAQTLIDEGDARKAVVAELYIDRFIRDKQCRGIKNDEGLALEYFDAVVKHKPVSPESITKTVTQD